MKTNIDLAREAVALLEIESQKAAIRQRSGLMSTVDPIPGEDVIGPKGTSIENVAAQLGIRVHFARQRVRVGKALIAAEAAGDTELAEEITELANEAFTEACRFLDRRQQGIPEPIKTCPHCGGQI